METALPNRPGLAQLGSGLGHAPTGTIAESGLALPLPAAFLLVAAELQNAVWLPVEPMMQQGKTWLRVQRRLLQPQLSGNTNRSPVLPIALHVDTGLPGGERQRQRPAGEIQTIRMEREPTLPAIRRVGSAIHSELQPLTQFGRQLGGKNQLPDVPGVSHLKPGM